MAITLRFPITQDFSTGHFGIPQGTTGRGGNDAVAICLHVLESPMETYISYLHSQRYLQDIRPNEHGSVHYGVEADGTLHQFVLDTNTAWGVREYSNPTWALLGDFSGIEPDYLFLHIGVEQFISPNIPNLMFRALAELIAKLCDENDIVADANHIISHTALQDTFDDCDEALATNLIATVQSLIAQGQEDVSVNVAQLFSQVAALQIQVDNLQEQVDDSLETIETYASHITTKAGASTLGHVESSSTIGVNPSTGVMNTSNNIAAYKIVEGTQSIVANIAPIVQFPTIISDELTWITLGVFQKSTPTVVGVYRIYARIEFAASTWTAGKYIQLTVFKNGATMQTLSYKIIEATLTSKKIELQGECEFVVSTLTDYYDVRVITDDANGTKTIAYGGFVIEKVGA